MTVDDVIQRVAEINAERNDDEMAHSDEDSLHQDVLVAISNGVDNAQELALEALKTLDISFARWCA